MVILLEVVRNYSAVRKKYFNIISKHAVYVLG